MRILLLLLLPVFSYCQEWESDTLFVIKSDPQSITRTLTSSSVVHYSNKDTSFIRVFGGVSFDLMVGPLLRTVADGDSVVNYIGAFGRDMSEYVIWMIIYNNNLLLLGITKDGTSWVLPLRSRRETKHG